MFQVFEGPSADSVWGQIATVFRNGEGTLQESRIGQMRELLHSALSISDPTQRWITSRLPPINLAFALAEVIWIVTGRNDSSFLNYFNSQLPRFAGDGDTYHGAYGYRLRKSLGFDQLERAYLALRAKPSSRQIVLQIWDSTIDLPSETGDEASPDIPCNVASLLSVRSNRLEWMQIMRSNDMYRGLPYNIVQFTMLQEVMAGWLSVDVGEYNQISNSLHIYESDFENIQRFDSAPAIPNTDSLAVSKQDSERYFDELARYIEKIIDQTLSAQDLSSLMTASDMPRSFQNILAILCAEGARRRKEIEIAKLLLHKCTNPAYLHLYNRWLMRVQHQ